MVNMYGLFLGRGRISSSSGLESLAKVGFRCLWEGCCMLGVMVVLLSQSGMPGMVRNDFEDKI